MKFRKKPVLIEAMKWDGMNDTELFAFAAKEVRSKKVVIFGEDVDIITLEGTMTAKKGDWIIRGVKDELYPCKPYIFEATYEPVESPLAKDVT